MKKDTPMFVIMTPAQYNIICEIASKHKILSHTTSKLAYTTRVYHVIRPNTIQSTLRISPVGTFRKQDTSHSYLDLLRYIRYIINEKKEQKRSRLPIL